MEKMNMIDKVIRRLGFYIGRLTARVKYRGMSIDGLFRGQRC